MSMPLAPFSALSPNRLPVTPLGPLPPGAAVSLWRGPSFPDGDDEAPALFRGLA